MKFGWLASHESNQPEALVEQAIEAERAGFDAVFASDHFHPWVDDAGSAAGFVWSWLGTVAARTEHVELATLVTAPLFHYHPALVAQAAATLDRLSNGRFRLGVGTGEAINETPLGYSFPGYRERADRLTEAIEIIRRLFEGEKVSYEGRYYQTDRARLYSPPLHSIPIWMAAGGPQSAEMAGREADGLIVSVKEPQETVEKVIQPFRQGGGEGKTIVATRWCVYAHDREEGWEALRPMRGLRAPGRLEAVDPMDLRIRADQMPREQIFSQYTYADDARELFETYRPLAESVGADYISIQIACVDPIGSIRLMGDEVLPRLRELRPRPIEPETTAAGASPSPPPAAVRTQG